MFFITVVDYSPFSCGGLLAYTPLFLQQSADITLFHRKTAMRVSALILVPLILAAVPAWAGPLRDAAHYVGDSVADTAGAVGKSVKGAADRVTGNEDPVRARQEIDAIAENTLRRLFKLDPQAHALFEKSYAYAVFDSRKSSFLLTSGAGKGVLVVRDSGARTYMAMRSLGIGAGAGMQFYQAVFMFETKRAADNFANSGWEADSTANATLGRKSMEAQVRFTNGMAYYQISDSGIMLDANIVGTKYWRDGKLNGK